MKISASKKTIVMLIILSAFFATSLLASIFLLKDAISNGIKYGRWFTLEKHEELLEHCILSNENKTQKIKCKALLQSTPAPEKSNGETCYYLQLISKEDGNFIRYKLCDKTEIIELKNPYKELLPGKLLATTLTISNKRRGLMHYSPEKIEILGVSEEELFNEWYKNENMYKIKEKLGSEFELIGEYPMKATYDGIELVNYQDYFGEIRLYNATIKEKSIKDSYIYLNIEGYINGRESSYNLTLKTKGFFVGANDTEEGWFVDASNLENMPKWERCILSLVYTTTDMQKAFGGLCNNDVEGFYKKVCDRNEEMLESDYESILKDNNDFQKLVRESNGNFYQKRGMTVLNINGVSSL